MEHAVSGYTKFPCQDTVALSMTADAAATLVRMCYKDEFGMMVNHDWMAPAPPTKWWRIMTPIQERR